VVYPEYFDVGLSRSEGRKVAKKYAIQSPKLEDITKAAKLAGLKPIVEEERSYPGKWHKRSGRIIVPKKFKKTKILQKMASKLKKTKKNP
jgi:signal recognition particle subunit SRP19